MSRRKKFGALEGTFNTPISIKCDCSLMFHFVEKNLTQFWFGTNFGPHNHSLVIHRHFTYLEQILLIKSAKQCKIGPAFG